MSSAMGYNFNYNYQDMPWLQCGNFGMNSSFMNGFNGAWGSNFGMGNIWGNSYSSTSGTTSSSSTSKTREQAFEEKEKKNAEIAAQIKTIQTEKQQIEEQLKEINNQEELKTAEDIVKSAKKGTKNEDGSVSVAADLKKMSTGEKIMRGGLNAWGGIGNVCKSLVCDPETGKISPWKVAGIVAVGAALAFAAPLAAGVAGLVGASAATVAATAATATTVASVATTAMATAGVAIGTYKTAKGVYDLNKALDNNSIEEFDKSTQDIGAGVFIGCASARGLKASSAEAGLAASSKNTTSNVFVKSFNATKNWLTDTFVSPWKSGAAKSAYIKDYTLNTLTQSGNSKIGFKAAWSATRAAGQSFKANLAETEFNQQKDAVIKSIEDEKSAILNQFKGKHPSEAEKALIKERLTKLNEIKQKISTSKNKEDWKEVVDLSEKYSSALKGYHKKWWKFWDNNDVMVGNKKLSVAERQQASSTIKGFKESSSNLSSNLTNLKNAKQKAMLKQVGLTEKAQEIKDFGLEDSKYSYKNCLTTLKLKLPKTFKGWAGWTLSTAMIPSAPEWSLQPVINKPIGLIANISEAVHPIRKESEKAILSNEQLASATETVSQKEAAVKQLEEALKQNEQKLRNICCVS
jgi:hypothetical protein